MKIEIEIDADRVEEQVVQEIAERLMNGYSTEVISHQIRKAMDEKVMDVVNQTLETEIAQVLSRPLRTYDVLGNPVGPEISLTDVLREGAKKFLEQRVKHDGTVSMSQYDTTKSRILWIVERVALEGLSKHITDEAKELRAQLQTKAREAAAALIASIRV